MGSRYIYVLGVTSNPVKIGLAWNIKSRLTSLQIGCPDPLVVHYAARVPDHLAQPVEAAAHKHFASRHRQGEWFNVDAEEAEAEVRRIAEEYCATNAALSRRGGDLLDMLAAKYPLDVAAREAVRRYMDRVGSPYGKQEVARCNAVIIKRCGAAAYTLFNKVIVENRSLYEFLLELSLDSAARDRAEAALAKAVNTLAEFTAYEREQALLNRVTRAA